MAPENFPPWGRVSWKVRLERPAAARCPWRPSSGRFHPCRPHPEEADPHR